MPDTYVDSQTSASTTSPEGVQTTTTTYLRIYIHTNVVTIPSVGAGNYYVSTSGNNSNPGTIAQPWRTLVYAATQIGAGDTLWIRGGTYQEQITFSTNGTAVNPITIRGYTGETVIIDGNNRNIPTKGSYGWLLRITGSYYTVRDIEVAYSGGYGMLFSSTATHCTAYNIYVHHCTRTGLYTNADYTLIDTCSAYANSQIYYDSGGSKWSTGICVLRNPYYCTVRNCIVWGTPGQGINTNECAYATVEDCIMYNNMFNGYCTDGNHYLWQRNISFIEPGNELWGLPRQLAMLIGDESVPGWPSSNNTIINNIFYGGNRVIQIGSRAFEGDIFSNNIICNSDDHWANHMLMWTGTWDYTAGEIKNNIFYEETAGGSFIYQNTTGLDWDYNLFSEEPDASARGAHDVIGDPLLAKTDNIDNPLWYKLLAGSPARGAGVTMASVVEDYWRTSRTAPPDIGPHEYS